MTTEIHDELDGLGRYDFGWADKDVAGANARRGINEDVVRDISAKKNEPEWMLEMRLKALRLFLKKPMPAWGSDLGGIDFDNIKYFVRSTEKQAASWDDLPDDIKNTYDRLGIPEAEKQRLVVRRRRAVRVRGRLPQDPRGPRGAGRHLPRHRHRAARARGHLQGVLRHRDPDR